MTAVVIRRFRSYGGFFYTINLLLRLAAAVVAVMVAVVGEGSVVVELHW